MEYKKILVPLDGSEFAECVLPHLTALTSSCRIADIELVSAVAYRNIFLVHFSGRTTIPI